MAGLRLPRNPSLRSSEASRAVKGGPTGPSEASRAAAPLTAPAERSYLGFASPESPTIIHGEPQKVKRSPHARAHPNGLGHGPRTRVAPRRRARASREAGLARHPGSTRNSPPPGLSAASDPSSSRSVPNTREFAIAGRAAMMTRNARERVCHLLRSHLQCAGSAHLSGRPPPRRRRGPSRCSGSAQGRCASLIIEDIRRDMKAGPLPCHQRHGAAALLVSQKGMIRRERRCPS